MKKLAEEKKRNEDKERRKFKEINPSLVVRTTKFLGAGTFGSCYLAFYRDMVVAVKEFKKKEERRPRSPEKRSAPRSYHDQTPERSPWCPSTLWYRNQERAHSTCHQVPREQKQRSHFTQSHKERNIRKAYLAWNFKKNYRGVKPHSFVWYSSQRREEQRREEQQRGNGATRRGVEPCDHRFWENSFLVRSQAGDV